MSAEQPLANVVACNLYEARGEEKMKRLMELVSMMNVTIGKDQDRDRLLAEKERTIRETEAREAEWKSRWEESKRAHDAEIARMQHLQDEAKRASDARETEWKRCIDIEMDRLRRIHEHEKKELIEAHEKRMAGVEALSRELDEETKRLHSMLDSLYNRMASLESRDTKVKLRLEERNKFIEENKKQWKRFKKWSRKVTLPDSCCLISARQGLKLCQKCYSSTTFIKT